MCGYYVNINKYLLSTHVLRSVVGVGGRRLNQIVKFPVVTELT